MPRRFLFEDEVPPKPDAAPSTLPHDPPHTALFRVSPDAPRGITRARVAAGETHRWQNNKLVSSYHFSDEDMEKVYRLYRVRPRYKPEEFLCVAEACVLPRHVIYSARVSDFIGLNEEAQAWMAELAICGIRPPATGESK